MPQRAGPPSPATQTAMGEGSGCSPLVAVVAADCGVWDVWPLRAQALAAASAIAARAIDRSAWWVTHRVYNGGALLASSVPGLADNSTAPNGGW